MPKRAIKKILITATLMLPVTFAPSMAAAGDPAGSTAARPTQYGRLIGCRTLTDAAARLQCFDREAAAFASAVEQNALQVVDRETVRNSKRRLFGLTIPSLGIFGNDSEEVTQVEGEILTVGRNGDGGTVFVLVDGARWSQTDNRTLAVAPRRGDKVTVKRGALGSYALSVDRQPGIKVRRVN